MKDQSEWLSTAEVPSYSPLAGDMETDVLVVGAGITGLTTAWLLQKEGLRVALIDQAGVGGGETGHTTAHLTYVTDTRLSELVHRFGRNRSSALWDAGRRAMHEIAEIATELDLPCRLREVPGYLVASPDGPEEEERSALAEDARLAVEMGFDAETISEDPLFGRPAVRFANQRKFHPVRYVSGLARALALNGSDLFTGTRAGAFQDGLMQGERGSIRFDTLVTATHIPIEGTRSAFDAALFQTKLAAYSTYAIHAEVSCRPEALFWDTGDPYLYLRFDRRTGGGCSVIIGGEDHKTGQVSETRENFARLEDRLRALLPEAKPVRRWSGQVWEPADGLPLIGEVSPRQYVATGFSGNGMTWGTFSAMAIRDAVVGRNNALAGLFSPDRKALAGVWDYVRENLDFPRHFLGDRLKASEDASSVRPGEGAICRVAGKRTAVFVDESGQRTLLSPICPHMGCVVQWNAAEKTWDCPCHGSRFLATGALLAGPAEKGLEPGES